MRCVLSLVLTLCLGEAVGEEHKEEFLCIHLDWEAQFMCSSRSF